MTFIEQFEEFKKKINALNTKTLPQDLAIQVNIVDDDCGGAFYIANISGDFAIEPYDYRDFTAMLTASADVYTNILAGKLDATDAYFRGILQIEGNLDHALALASLKKKPAKKAAAKKPAKKAAAKKPAAKKTAAKKAAPAKKAEAPKAEPKK